MLIMTICFRNLVLWADCSRGWARQCRWGIGRQWACRLQGWAWACARPWGCQVDAFALHDDAKSAEASAPMTCQNCSNLWTPSDLVRVYHRHAAAWLWTPAHGHATSAVQAAARYLSVPRKISSASRIACACCGPNHEYDVSRCKAV